MLLSPNVRREERVQRLQRRRDVRHGRGTAAGGLESFSIWNSTILRLLEAAGLAPLLCYIQEYISNWKTLEAAWLISTNKLSSDPALYMQTPPLQDCWNREGQGGQSPPPPCGEKSTQVGIWSSLKLIFSKWPISWARTHLRCQSWPMGLPDTPLHPLAPLGTASRCVNLSKWPILVVETQDFGSMLIFENQNHLE